MATGGSVYSTFADWFAKQIVDRASGRIMPSDAVGGDLVRRRPADAFFIGSVGPASLALDGRG